MDAITRNLFCDSSSLLCAPVYKSLNQIPLPLCLRNIWMGPEASINVTSSQVKVKEKDQVARQIISKRLSGRVKLRTKVSTKATQNQLAT